MNAASHRVIRSFNPGTFQADAEVIEQFVVRKPELDVVLEVLRGNIDSASCQHVLVVAPRGRGKTMLLARVAAELRTNDAFAQHLLPVRFMEESHEVFNMADFWLDSLFYLARASMSRDSELARELRETHAALTARWREQALEEHARAAVLGAADRLGRKLVLMVENLQALCENAGNDFGWKLRSALQSESQIMLLATATSHFEALNDVEQPFFELFRTIVLKPLDTSACRRLWQTISGDEVSEREIRPLEILTGGSPRLLVVLAGFARHRSLRQLMEELVTLIDNHTEYFRGHLEILGKTERRVYLAVIDLWQPSNTSEIAARARMDVRPVSALLGRLVNRGAVIVEGKGRKLRYAAAERLYNIYYKLRRERDEAAVVQNLIRFMAAFYSPPELAEMSRTMSLEAIASPAIREGIERVLIEQPETGSIFASEAWRDTERIAEPAAVIDDTKAMQLLKEFEEALGAERYDKVVESLDQVFAFWNAVSNWVPDSFPVEFYLVKAFAHERLGDFQAAIATYDEMVNCFGASDMPEIQLLVAKALIGKGLVRKKVDVPEAALAVFDEVVERFGASDTPELRRYVAEALVNKGVMQGKLNHFKAALMIFDDVIERFGASDAPELQLYSALALVFKGVARGGLGDPDAAIMMFDEVVERFGSSDTPGFQVVVAEALANKGVRQNEVGHAADALHTCGELEGRLDALTGGMKIEFAWRAMCVRTRALLIQQKHQDAMDAFRSAYAVFVPGDELMLNELLQLARALIAAGVPEHDLVDILLSDKAKSDSLLSLIVALQQRAGEMVRAPAEVIEVAADVRERIEETM